VADLHHRIDAFTDRIGQGASWLVLAIVMLMACNVLLRYLFSTSSVWAQELEWHLLVPLVLAGMSYTLRHGEHVRSDILYHRLSERARARIDLASSVLLVLIALAIAWLSLLYVQQAFVIGEKSPDPGGLAYRWALKAMMPVGFALLAVQAMSCAIASLQQLRATRA